MKLQELPEWLALQEHFNAVKSLELRELFEKNPQRFDDFSLRFEDILVDFSKNRITEQTLKLLLAFAEARGVEEWREKMFSGEKINSK